MNDRFIVRIGGSLIYEGSKEKHVLNYQLLNRISRWLKQLTQNGNQLICIVGGGLLSRGILDMAMQGIKTSPDDSLKHFLAMHVTRVNAAIYNLYVNDANWKISFNLDEIKELFNSGYSILTAGLIVGGTTDFTAASIATSVGLKDIYKLSNIDGVYSKDPYKYRDAVLYDQLTWQEYADIFGGMDLNRPVKNSPNMHGPIDFECMQYAYSHGLTFHIYHGKQLAYDPSSVSVNFERKGTVIR